MLRCVYIFGGERVIIPPLRPVPAMTRLMVIIGYVFGRLVIFLRARFRWIHLGIGFVARLHWTTDREAVIPTFQILGCALGAFRNGQVIRSGRLIVRATFVRVFGHLRLRPLTGRRFQPLSGIVPEQRSGNVDSCPIHSHRFLPNDPRLDGYLGGGPLIPGVGVSLRDEIGQLGRRSGRETSFLRYSSGWRHPTVHH